MNPVISVGRHLTLNHSDPLDSLYLNPSDEFQKQANIRLNTMTKMLEIHTNGYWTPLTRTFTRITFVPEAELAIDWVLKKIKEEEHAKELAKTNNSVRLAMDAVKTAEQHLSTVLVLAQSDMENNNVRR